jgi:hypothetical protein
MEGEMDPFDFTLAEALGRTVDELGSMPHVEYLKWRAYYVWREAQRELERKSG